MGGILRVAVLQDGGIGSWDEGFLDLGFRVIGFCFCACSSCFNILGSTLARMLLQPQAAQT